MIVHVDKSFEKDVKNIKDEEFLKELATIILEIQSHKEIRQIKNLKKL